ncbi:MAG: hypothetical protein OK474_08700 [Thaumarchaeota archaeon]|nr:hypothetical protein [Nitrososphaerota archaeon]
MSEIDGGTDERSTEHVDEAANVSGVFPIDREEAELAPVESLNGMVDAAPDVSKTEEPVLICDVCGPVPGPGAEVFQCTLCMGKFCVQHIDPYLHLCPVARSG